MSDEAESDAVSLVIIQLEVVWTPLVFQIANKVAQNMVQKSLRDKKCLEEMQR